MRSEQGSQEHPAGRPDIAIGPACRHARSRAADGFLGPLLAGDGTGFALVAVGGYGRQELAPGSDLDVVLLHDPGLSQDHVTEVAEKIWYPVWDSGAKLDHSVRTVAEARELATAELAVAAGLLDARLVAGDAGLVAEVRAAVFGDWRREAARRLGELREEYDARLARHGELAYRLEGDLKESRGGLRDSVMLRFISASWLVDVPHGAPERARAFLLDVRDALHTASGRALDRLLLQEQDAVARLLGLAFPEHRDSAAENVFTSDGDAYTSDADIMTRRVAEAAGTITYAAESAWRQVDAALRARTPGRLPVRRPLADGVVEQDGEVFLALTAAPSRDPVLVLRAAAAAAESGLTFAPNTLRRLAEESAPLPRPWPRAAREAFATLLGAGPGLFPVWEALDRSGVLGRLLPEWRRIRSLPQRNSLHIHTVDRHTLETVVAAVELTRTVTRPDLLLVAALLHDIGKGLRGDHSQTGAVLTADLGAALGFRPDDVSILTGLVRYHLLLPDLATRRDPDDPATLATLLEALGELPCPRLEALRLLHALSEADSRATGPAAWNPWRAGLYHDLVVRAEAALLGFDPPVAEPCADERAASLAERCRAAGDQLVVEIDGGPGGEPVGSAGGLGGGSAAEATGSPTPDPAVVFPVELPASVATVSVATPDRIGVLAAAAGVLALRRLQIRGATTETVGGIAVQTWTVAVDWESSDLAAIGARLRQDLRAALAGTLDVGARLASREGDGASERTRRLVAPPRVTVLDGASATATVLEVRAHDAPGLVHRITSELAAEGISVRSARISTLGAEAVDVFYVVDPAGRELDPAEAHRVAKRVEAVLAGGNVVRNP